MAQEQIIYRNPHTGQTLTRKSALKHCLRTVQNPTVERPGPEVVGVEGPDHRTLTVCWDPSRAQFTLRATDGRTVYSNGDHVQVMAVAEWKVTEAAQPVA